MADEAIAIAADQQVEFAGDLNAIIRRLANAIEKKFSPALPVSLFTDS